MTAEIIEGLDDWAASRAYIDGNRNYHLKVKDERGFTIGRPIARWNKAVKRAYPDVSAFHDAAMARKEGRR